MAALLRMQHPWRRSLDARPAGIIVASAAIPGQHNRCTGISRSDAHASRRSARSRHTSNCNPSALAINKFRTTAGALAFGYDLYAAGAKEVLIDNIMEDIRPGDGGPYADSLIVRPPDDVSGGSSSSAARRRS
jgi:hypothetical protein